MSTRKITKCILTYGVECIYDATSFKNWFMRPLYFVSGYYEAAIYLPLSTLAGLHLVIQMTFVAIASRILLKQKINNASILLFIISITGTILITQPYPALSPSTHLCKNMSVNSSENGNYFETTTQSFHENRCNADLRTSGAYGYLLLLLAACSLGKSICMHEHNIMYKTISAGSIYVRFIEINQEKLGR